MMKTRTFVLGALALVAGLCGPVANAASVTKTSLNLGGSGRSFKNVAKEIGAQKIIGGTTISITLRPYMASISLFVNKKWDLQCGATILDKYHILSSGHCFNNRNKALYRVRTGTNSRTTGGTVSTVANIAVHPKFNKTSLDYDVAVLKLARPLTLNNKDTAAVKLCTSKVAPGIPVILAGWGYTDSLHANALPDKLQQTKVTTIDHQECSDDYSGTQSVVTARMFCAMSEDGSSKDSCQGDSGGPVLNFRTNQQMGLISWSQGCAQMGSPGVFCDLNNPEIRSFVNEQIKK